MASSIKFFFKRLYLYSSTALHGNMFIQKSHHKKIEEIPESQPNPPFRLRSYCLPTHQRAPANRHHAPDGGRASSDVETSKAAASVAESG